MANITENIKSSLLWEWQVLQEKQPTTDTEVYELVFPDCIGSKRFCCPFSLVKTATSRCPGGACFACLTERQRVCVTSVPAT